MSDVTDITFVSQVEPAAVSSQVRPADLVPDDLLEPESPLKHEPPPPPANGARPGTTGKPRPFSLVAIGLIIISTTVTCGVIGALQRGDLTRILNQVIPPPSLLPNLVDAQNGIVLMLEHSGELGRVNVLKFGQASWLLVSGDDTSASSPALSEDGKLVSYISKQSGGKVVVVSLINDIRLEIGFDEIQEANAVAKSESMIVCPWSSATWDPDNTHIAFFACSQRRSYSAVVVASIPGLSLTLSAGSEAESLDLRQAIWLDPHRIVVTMPVSGTQPSAVVKVIQAP